MGYFGGWFAVETQNYLSALKCKMPVRRTRQIDVCEVEANLPAFEFVPAISLEMKKLGNTTLSDQG